MLGDALFFIAYCCATDAQIEAVAEALPPGF
jgi:hypothetical protein